MTWVRIDENFSRHPKVMRAGPLGVAMQVAALCYCNQYLTDGFIPESVPPTLLDLRGLGMRIWSGELVGGGEDASEVFIVADLLDAGLWKEVEGGYQIHDFHDYQPTRAQVLADRKMRNERAAAGGNARAAGAERDDHGRFVSAGQTSDAPAFHQPSTSTVSGPVSVPQDTDISLTEGETREGGVGGGDASFGRAKNSPTDIQTYLLRQLHDLDDTWKKLTWGGVVKLNTKHGTSAVNAALQRAWEERPALTSGAYPLLDAICLSVLQEREETA